MSDHGFAKEVLAVQVVRTAAIPNGNVQHSIRAEVEGTGVVIELRLVDAQQLASCAGIDDGASSLLKKAGWHGMCSMVFGIV